MTAIHQDQGGLGAIRPIRPEDVAEALSMIGDLAEYEREPDAVENTEQMLHQALFSDELSATGQPALHGLVVEHPAGPNRRLGGMALWFLNYSTWVGRHGIYLEDLYVRPEVRGRGYGAALLRALAQICVERGYGRLEWSVLDWNEPAIGFYRSIGAFPMDGWTVNRLDQDGIANLAQSGPPRA